MPDALSCDTRLITRLKPAEATKTNPALWAIRDEDTTINLFGTMPSSHGWHP